MELSKSAAQSYFTVGPLECFGTLGNNNEVTYEIQRDASRFLYSLCNVVNPTTPEPRPSTYTLDYTEQKAEPTTRRITVPVMKTVQVKPAAKLSTTGKPIEEVSTSQPTPTDVNVPSAKTHNEAAQTVSDVDLHTSSDAPATMVSLGLPASNNTQVLVDPNGDLTSFDQDAASTGVRKASEVSWELMVAWTLLIVVFLMFTLVISYFFKKRRRVRGYCLFGVKKKKKQQKLEETYGFPEVRLRSRSGELDLSDVRRSIEAGSYNVTTGTIAYGESFYM